jgi:hypothetical protein
MGAALSLRLFFGFRYRVQFFGFCCHCSPEKYFSENIMIVSAPAAGISVGITAKKGWMSQFSLSSSRKSVLEGIGDEIVEDKTSTRYPSISVKWSQWGFFQRRAV